jgi:metal-sulfur cluster biosynthetic enzyme
MDKTATVTEEDVYRALSMVYDPELGLDIVSLGLIYDVRITDGVVYVLMTLTTMGCPMHDSISVGAEFVLRELEGVKDVKLELTFDPPWDPGRMSDAARMALGFY